MSMFRMFKLLAVKPGVDSIILGENITSHYLNPDSSYQLFRYHKIVYAVRYENQKPVESIQMWKSHKQERSQKVKPKELGSGDVGRVFEKTPDKAIKKFTNIPIAIESTGNFF